jgi:ABC-type transport system substrate-binding protein
MKRVLAVTLFFLATISLSLTLGSSFANAESPKYGGTLRIVLGASPGTFGYPPHVFGESASASYFCFDTLLREVKGKIIPWLAESYQVSDDRSSITFNLRKGVKFHDGTDFNAAAAKWNLDEMISKKRAPYWKSIDVIDDYTIRVNLKTWRNFLVSEFAGSTKSWMVSPTAFKEKGIEWIRTHPVGTGPFKFVSYERDVAMIVERNPDYWIKGKPYVDRIENMYIADPTTKLMLMKSGGADMILAEPGKRAADLEAAGFPVNVQLVVNYTLIPDTRNEDSPFVDKRVREAMAYAIDREAMAKGLSYGYWKATYQLPARDTMAYDENFKMGRRYDPKKAKKLLADAGYKKGFKTKIISAPAGRNKDLCAAVQAYLGAVGIQCEMVYPDQAKFMKFQMGSFKHSIIIQPVGAYLNNDKAIQFFLSPTSPRFKDWKRPAEFTRLFEISSTSAEPDAKLMKAYHDVLIEEAAVIPVGSAGKSWGIQPYVMNPGLDKRYMAGFFQGEEVWLNK